VGVDATPPLHLHRYHVKLKGKGETIEEGKCDLPILLTLLSKQENLFKKLK